MQETEAAWKICIFGDARVGKTSLTQRFLTGLFEFDSKSTLGATIFVKYLHVEKKKVALQIWDFGGEDKFRFLLPVYSMGSSAGIFMYDITQKSSLDKINDWITFFREGLEKDAEKVPIFMVGSKKDLESQRTLPHAQALAIFDKYKLFKLIEVSSKNGENIEALFKTITNAVAKNAGLIK